MCSRSLRTCAHILCVVFPCRFVETLCRFVCYCDYLSTGVARLVLSVGSFVRAQVCARVLIVAVLSLVACLLVVFVCSPLVLRNDCVHLPLHVLFVRC